MKDNSNITPELLETVERYYNGTMAEQERADFAERLRNEPVFKTEVEDIRATLMAIEHQSLKEQLDSFHQDLPTKDPIKHTEKPTAKVHFRIFMKIAIAAVIVIGLGMFWYWSGSSHEKLYSEYFTPDPGLPTTMSSSDNYIFYDGMVNYKQGQYDRAISKWKKLEPKTTANDTLDYFLGVAYLADKNPEQALVYLDKTIENGESVFLEDAYFYLGLAHLKMENLPAAREAFQKSNSEKSKDILKHLD